MNVIGLPYCKPHTMPTNLPLSSIWPRINILYDIVHRFFKKPLSHFSCNWFKSENCSRFIRNIFTPWVARTKWRLFWTYRILSVKQLEMQTLFSFLILILFSRNNTSFFSIVSSLKNKYFVIFRNFHEISGSLCPSFSWFRVSSFTISLH